MTFYQLHELFKVYMDQIFIMIIWEGCRRLRSWFISSYYPKL